MTLDLDNRDQMNGLERDTYIKVLLNCYTHDSVIFLEEWLGKRGNGYEEEGVACNTRKGSF